MTTDFIYPLYISGKLIYIENETVIMHSMNETKTKEKKVFRVIVSLKLP